MGSDKGLQIQIVEVHILDIMDCLKVFGGEMFTIRMLCGSAVLNDEGEEKCYLESGGPLVFNSTLRGLISWGFGCASPGYPGIYGNVAHPDLRDFITLVTGL